MNSSAKRVVGFHQDAEGLFLDLEDQPCAVGVSRRTGDVLLDEGPGPDRYHGAAIPCAAHPRFFIYPEGRGNEARLELQFGRVRHRLGTTPLAREALQWVVDANRLVTERLLRQTADADDQDLTARGEECLWGSSFTTPPPRGMLNLRDAFKAAQGLVGTVGSTELAIEILKQLELGEVVESQQ